MVNLGFGIVGTGEMAEEMARAIVAAPGCGLVAVASRDRTRAEDFAGRHGAAAGHGDLQGLLADERVDVVYVATPNALHAQQVIEAAGAGKHVLCDKPLATSRQDGLRAIEACEEAGVALGVNFQLRHHPVWEEVQQLVASGSAGRVEVVQVEVSPGLIPLTSWRTDRELAGLGTLYNLGVHGFDLLRFLLRQEVDEARAIMPNGAGELETLALALLRFEDGPLAAVTVNQSLAWGDPHLELYFEAGRARVQGGLPARYDAELELAGEEGERRASFPGSEIWVRTVTAFARAVRERATPSASGLDGLRALDVAQAVAEAARTGRAVRPTT